VDRVVLPGVVKARPDGHASVTPPLSGILIPPPGRHLPALGEKVDAGQVLALVQPPAFDLLVKIGEAEADALRAGLALDRAELVLVRTKKLAAESARSARDVEEAEFAARKAKVDREAALTVQTAYRRFGAVLDGWADGKGGLPALEVKAPITGLVTQVASAPGEQVSPDRPVAEILDPVRVYIEARVPEVDLGKLAPGLAASFETPDAPGRLDPILPGSGRVVLLGLSVDPSSRTVPITYEVDNTQGRLRIGMAVTIHVETARAETALVVPRSSIVDEDVRTVAFVQVAGETFQKRDLILGIRDGDVLQVVRGLEEGDRVVTRGAYALRLASVATSIPAHGHAH
jgi:RND family efflux transporter MFP subunit